MRWRRRRIKGRWRPHSSLFHQISSGSWATSILRFLRLLSQRALVSKSFFLAEALWSRMCPEQPSWYDTHTPVPTSSEEKSAVFWFQLETFRAPNQFISGWNGTTFGCWKRMVFCFNVFCFFFFFFWTCNTKNLQPKEWRWRNKLTS